MAAWPLLRQAFPSLLQTCLTCSYFHHPTWVTSVKLTGPQEAKRDQCGFISRYTAFPPVSVSVAEPLCRRGWNQRPVSRVPGGQSTPTLQWNCSYYMHLLQGTAVSFRAGLVLFPHIPEARDPRWTPALWNEPMRVKKGI